MEECYELPGDCRSFLPNLNTLEIGSLEKVAVTTQHANLPNQTITISYILLELSKIATYCFSHIFLYKKYRLEIKYRYYSSIRSVNLLSL